MNEAAAAEGTTLRDYLQVARRRKWIILLTTILVPVAAIVFSLRQTTLYQASAEVLLNRQSAATVSGVSDPNTYYQPERVLQTQSELARVPAVADRVIEAAGANMSAPAFLADSSVTSEPNSDILTFKVTNESPDMAKKLATQYARQFTEYKNGLDTTAIARALSGLTSRIAQLEESGDNSSALYKTLIDKEQQLRTLQALQTSTLSVIREADQAVQTQPRMLRNIILALLVGLVLGIGLAFLWDALDIRVRTAEEIGGHLGLPLLARLPAPPRGVRSNDQLSSLVDPHGVQAEAFRMLRTNLDFANLDRSARTIMITSAVESEGKSTTAANLAVTFARSGQVVTLVDLDLRRPFLARFFRLGSHPGLTQVALGYTDLDDALVPIPDLVGGPQSPNENGKGDGGGMLRVLPAGPIPPNPGEFVSSHVISEIIAEVRDRSHLVLIDAPPLLRVGDAMALSAKADAILVVTRLGIVRRPMLRELHRLLEVAPTAKLGFVVTGAEEEEDYAYSGYRSYATDSVEQERVR